MADPHEPTTGGSIRVKQVGFDHPDVQVLVAGVQAEYVEIYGGGDETPIDLHEFDPPNGAFLLVYDTGQPVAMGGWRLRPDIEALGGLRAAEVKRMYVVPARRRQGLAQLTLTSLEDSARGQGADVMVLETGLPQQGAVALYDSAGYVDAGTRFGFYADSEHAIYLGKRL